MTSGELIVTWSNGRKESHRVLPGTTVDVGPADEEARETWLSGRRGTVFVRVHGQDLPLLILKT